MDDLCNHPSCKHYWMYGVLTGYLMNEEHLNFDQFMSNDVNESITVKHVVDWYFGNSTKKELISLM